MGVDPDIGGRACRRGRIGNRRDRQRRERTSVALLNWTAKRGAKNAPLFVYSGLYTRSAPERLDLREGHRPDLTLYKPLEVGHVLVTANGVPQGFERCVDNHAAAVTPAHGSGSSPSIPVGERPTDPRIFIWVTAPTELVSFIRLRRRSDMVGRTLVATTLCLAFVIPSEAFSRDRWRPQPGVKVQLKNKSSGTLTLARRGFNVSGTFDCSCAGGTGGCTLSQTGGALICYKGGSDTCTNQCRLSTTIPSAVRGVLVRQ
jgi:hypothetical protein